MIGFYPGDGFGPLDSDDIEFLQRQLNRRKGPSRQEDKCDCCGEVKPKRELTFSWDPYLVGDIALCSKCNGKEP